MAVSIADAGRLLRRLLAENLFRQIDAGRMAAIRHLFEGPLLAETCLTKPTRVLLVSLSNLARLGKCQCRFDHPAQVRLQPCRHLWQVVERQLLLHVAALGDLELDRVDRKSTRLNSSHIQKSRMPSSA